MTAEGSIKGTVAYMAPEQALVRSGRCAHGCLFVRPRAVQMLSGPRPSADTASLQELIQRTKQPPVPVRSLNGQVPVALDAIVSRCLSPIRPSFSADGGSRGSARCARPTRERSDYAVAREDLEPTRLSASARVISSTRGAAITASPPGGGALVHWSARSARRGSGRSRGIVASHALRRRQLHEYDRRGRVRWHGRRSANHRPGERVVPQRVQPARGDAARGNRGAEGAARRADGATGGHPRRTRPRDRGGRSRDQRRRLSVARPRHQSRHGFGSLRKARAVSTKDRVLEAIGELAREFRRALGEVPLEASGQGTTTGAPETFTAATLEAAHAYTEAQRLADSGRDNEAVESYDKAVTLDPNFGRAYSGLGVSYSDSAVSRIPRRRGTNACRWWTA